MKLILLLSSIIIIVFLNLGNYLDTTTKPTQSDIIFCLGGFGPDRLETSLDLLHNDYSNYNKLYYSGIKNDLLTDTEDLNITYIWYLRNTMAEILYIDNLIEKEKYTSVIIVTDPPHSRRVSFMINKFSKNIKGKYIIVSSHPSWWNTHLYFLNYQAFIFSLKEIGKLFYNYFKYTLKYTFDPNFTNRYNKFILENETSIKK